MNTSSIDTQAELSIFPKPIGKSLIVGCLGIIALGGAVIPFAWPDRDWRVIIAGAIVFCAGLGLLVALLRRRARGSPLPSITLSPAGLEFHAGLEGIVPWAAVLRLGSQSIANTPALLIHLDKQTLDALPQGAFFETSRKFDAALGIHSVALMQQQLELPIETVANLLHHYSITHGGPALQPDP